MTERHASIISENAGIGDVQKLTTHTLTFRNTKRTGDMFQSDHSMYVKLPEDIMNMRKRVKATSDYSTVLHMATEKKQKLNSESINGSKKEQSSALIAYNGSSSNKKSSNSTSTALIARSSSKFQRAAIMPKPRWHAPWKLYRVISGHLGWVRCLAFEPGNQWFATGSGDRTIKIWDLGSAKLKLTLTGHISTVRGLVVSQRQPYLFSCGEDKQVKCWDLEQNKVVRHYHGHLSACHAIDLHPTLDIVASCGRDMVARIWDMRSKANVMTLSGHKNTVADVKCQDVMPEVVTASHDCTIRLWDLAANKTRAVLTNHKKSIRSIAMHPTEYTFASGAPDNIKKWKFPDGDFLQNLSGHNAIVNSLAVNSDNVLVSGADNGTMNFWDWRTGYNYQQLKAPVQPGSLDSESGIFAMGFDKTQTRLITCEADKTIKIYKQDTEATEESHPVEWKPEILRRKRF